MKKKLMTYLGLILVVAIVFLFGKRQGKLECEEVQNIEQERMGWFCNEVYQVGHDFPLTKEEYAVYSAFIQQMLKGLGGKNHVLIKETVEREECSISEPYQLDAKLLFVDGAFYELLNDGEAKELTELIESKGGYKEFYKRYRSSAGILSLSRIGFNDSHDEAILSYALLYPEGGGWSSQGKILRKQNHGWKLTDDGVGYEAHYDVFE